MANSALYKAIGRSLSARYFVYAANLISLAVLSRIYGPQEYGSIAAVMVFFGFFQLLSESGLGPAIVNLEKLSATHRDGIFGLSLALSVLAAAVFWLLGDVIINFYENPRLEKVVPYIAASMFFFGSAIVPTSLLLREQAFSAVAKAGVVAEVVSTTVVIMQPSSVDTLAALAAKTPLYAAVNLVFVWVYSAETEFGRPVPGTKFGAVRPLLRMSLYQLGFNFINYFSRNSDNALVGKFLGAGALGIYERSYRLMMYPLLLLTSAMSPAIQPVIRRSAINRKKVEKIHRDFIYRLSLAGAAAGLGIFFFSEEIVLLLLGPEWGQVASILKILAVSVPIQVVLSSSGGFFQAMARTDLLMLSGALSALVTVAAIVYGVRKGSLETLSWCIVAAFHLNSLQAYYILYRQVFYESMWIILLRIAPSMVAALVMSLFLLKLDIP